MPLLSYGISKLICPLGEEGSEILISTHPAAPSKREEAEYFERIIKKIENPKHKQMFYIDSSKVVNVTTDALVYILAILYNIKLNIVHRYSFKGNLPISDDARNVYLESGFMNYVKTKRATMPKTSDKIQILSGQRTEPMIAGRVCDFVISSFNQDYRFTLNLYKTLIELMSNTFQHAYHKSKMKPYWYLYAIDLGNTIQFTFIDTGEGIPNTVKRKWVEKIPFAGRDCDLMYSAFMGESRTETNLYNRGHGLPALYEKVIKGQLINFFSLSGKGGCKSVEKEGEIYLEKIEYDNEIFGTIFQFEISNSMEEIKC